MTVAEALAIARNALWEQPSAKLESELLIAHLFGMDRTYVLTHPEEEVNEVALAHLLERRLGGEPLAYILGRREFFGRDFTVTPDVLIPRQETEELVLAALDRIGKNDSVVDVGTGSGCIAVTLALECPTAALYATELSERALRIAELNAERHGCVIAFSQADLLTPFPEGAFDVIVSNPPYVDRDFPLSKEVRDFEPATALFAEQNGVAIIQRLIQQANRLRPGGWLLMEIGYDQGEAVRELLRRHGLANVEIRQDLAGRDRVALAQRVSQ